MKLFIHLEEVIDAFQPLMCTFMLLPADLHHAMLSRRDNKVCPASLCCTDYGKTLGPFFPLATLRVAGSLCACLLSFIHESRTRFAKQKNILFAICLQVVLALAIGEGRPYVKRLWLSFSEPPRTHLSLEALHGMDLANLPVLRKHLKHVVMRCVLPITEPKCVVVIVRNGRVRAGGDAAGIYVDALFKTSDTGSFCLLRVHLACVQCISSSHKMLFYIQIVFEPRLARKRCLVLFWNEPPCPPSLLFPGASRFVPS